MSEKLPDGYQPVYVAYTGTGTSIYFTAESNSQARKFLEQYHPEALSCFETAMILKARGNYTFRQGLITLYFNADILKEDNI